MYYQGETTLCKIVHEIKNNVALTNLKGLNYNFTSE